MLIIRDGDRRLQRIDPTTGDLMWVSGRIQNLRQSSVIVGVVDSTVIVYSDKAGGRTRALDLATGCDIWNHHAKAGVNARPTLGEHVILLSDQNGTGSWLAEAHNRRPLGDIPVSVSNLAVDGNHIEVVSAREARRILPRSTETPTDQTADIGYCRPTHPSPF